MFLYVLLRAYNVYFTCDEGWTVHAYMNNSVYNILTFKPVLANNHVVNSLLVKFCSLFSLSELSLRLPNVLAYILYLYAVAGIAGIYFKEKGILYWSLIIGLCLNPSLSEFFAYARGYGISIAFMMLSLYQLILSYERSNYKKHIQFALAALIFGTYANLVLLNVVPAIFLLALYIIYLKQDKKSFWKALPVPFIYGVLLLLVVGYPAYILKTSGELYWGGITNFISDTLASLMEDLFALKRWTIIWGVMLAMFLIVLFIAFIILLKGLSKKNRNEANLPLYIAPALLVFCTVFVNAEFYLGGVHLLKHRTALFLYPISILSIFSAVRLYARNKPVIASRFSTAFAIVLIGAFLYNMNISESEEWTYNKYDEQVSADIIAAGGNKPVTLFADQYHAFCVNYYIQKNKLPMSLSPVTDVEKMASFTQEYIYVFEEQAKFVPANYTVWKNYGDGKFLLYKKKN